MKRLHGVALLLGLALLAAPAFAAEGGNEVVVGAGVGIPTGDFGDVAKVGFTLSAGGAHHFSSELSAGLQFDYAHSGVKGLDSVDDVSGSLSMTGGSAFARYKLSQGKNQPYLIGNFGVMRFKGDFSASGDGFDASLSVGETKPFVAAGVGLDVPAGQNLKVFVQATYNIGFTSDTNTTWLGAQIGIRYGLK